MFAIDEEKLPPPRPAVAAHATRIHICVRVRLRREPAARHEEREQRGRDQQQRGAERRPHASAVPRYRERVRDPQERADEVRDRDEDEQLRDRQDDADVREVDDDDRPQHPHAEAEVLGEDREDEVLAGDLLAGGLPHPLVVRLPVLDPPASRQQRGLSRRRLDSLGRVDRRAHVSSEALVTMPTFQSAISVP